MSGVHRLVLDDYWVDSTIGDWSGLKYQRLAHGGCGQASWTMQLPNTYSHPLLRRGRIVQIKIGGTNRYAGVLSEPRNSADGVWEFTAQGLHTLGGGGNPQRGFLCLDGDLNTTSIPDVAVDQAIGRGLPWVRPASISGAPFSASDTTRQLNYITALLNAYCGANSLRWGINPDRELYTAADPTAPTLHLIPGVGRLGLSDDDYASTVYVRWKVSAAQYDTAPASDPEAAQRSGPLEIGASATKYGVIAPATAAAIAQGLIDAGQARLAWTDPVSPSLWQATNNGGNPVPGWMIEPQEVMRLWGVADDQGRPVPYVDVVIGQIDVDDDQDTVTLAPTVMADRQRLSEMLADLGGAA